MPLTVYAKTQNLSARPRLELLILICEAVQYAHQKSFIHRDLKPANILVNEQGQPKILDFGVALVTAGDLQTTLQTAEFGGLVGTIPYMSPEQVAGDPLQLDTRSDVYALGVIAYELLAGTMPYKLLDKGLPEVLRTIREEEPSRLGNVDRTFRGDIETIVAKSLEKDKDRRYGSASELAADIRRHLNHEPIAARPVSTWYQITRFSRRNRALVSGVIAAFVLLILGITGTSAGMVRASRARAVAEARRQESEGMYQVLLHLRPTDPDDPGRSTADPQLAVQQTKALLSRATDKPRMANFLCNVGYILDIRGESNAARQILELVVLLSSDLRAENQPTPREAALGLAEALFRRGWCKAHQGDALGAIPDMKACIDLRYQYLPVSPQPDDDVVAAMADLARIELYAGQEKESTDEYIAMMAMIRNESPTEFKKHLEATLTQVGLLGLSPTTAPKAREVLLNFIEPFLTEARPHVRARVPYTLARLTEYLYKTKSAKVHSLERPVLNSAVRILADVTKDLANQMAPPSRPTSLTKKKTLEIIDHLQDLMGASPRSATQPAKSASGD